MTRRNRLADSGLAFALCLPLQRLRAIRESAVMLPPKADMCSAVSPRPSRLFDRPGVSPNVKSQSANKQCHHFDRRHKTVPSENAPKQPTRNGDDERPSVLPDPVHHEFFPNTRHRAYHLILETRGRRGSLPIVW